MTGPFLDCCCATIDIDSHFLFEIVNMWQGDWDVHVHRPLFLNWFDISQHARGNPCDARNSKNEKTDVVISGRPNWNIDTEPEETLTTELSLTIPHNWWDLPEPEKRKLLKGT